MDKFPKIEVGQIWRNQNDLFKIASIGNQDEINFHNSSIFSTMKNENSRNISSIFDSVQLSRLRNWFQDSVLVKPAKIELGQMWSYQFRDKASYPNVRFRILALSGEKPNYWNIVCHEIGHAAYVYTYGYRSVMLESILLNYNNWWLESSSPQCYYCLCKNNSDYISPRQNAEFVCKVCAEI